MRGINGVGGLLGRLGIELSSLEEDNLLATAAKNVGHDDFGDDDFRAPLRILLDAIENEAELHSLGRIIGRRTVLGYLETD